MSVSPPSPRLVKVHTLRVKSVAFSPDGTKFASSSDNNIILWDAKSATPIGEPIASSDGSFRAGSIAFSPDGTKLAACDSFKITIWDVHRRTLEGELLGNTSWVMSVAFSPGGDYVVSGSDDNTVRIWSLPKCAMVSKPLQGHRASVQGVAFSPNGVQVVSVSDDGIARVWDVNICHDFDIPLENVILYNERQYPPSLFPSHVLKMQDGWAVNSDGDLILWIPHAHRLGLRGPGARRLNNQPITELDFERFKYGTEWAHCYRGS